MVPKVPFGRQPVPTPPMTTTAVHSPRLEGLAGYAWLPIPALLVAIAILNYFDDGPAHESPQLLLALSFAFRSLVPLFVAGLIARTFLARRHAGLLFLGCGLLLWASASVVKVAFAPHGVNAIITIYNNLLWLSAACHVVGALLSLVPLRPMRAPGFWIAGSYTLGVGIGALMTFVTLKGWLPVYFVQGDGGTPLRQTILGSGILMFFVAAALLWERRTMSLFSCWYALALTLIGVGLMAGLTTSALDNTLSWVGRVGQFLGGLYLLAAAIASVRETRAWEIPLEAQLGEVRHQYATLVETCPEAIIVQKLGVCVFVNPAALRLFGATRAEEITGQPMLSRVHEEDRQRVADLQLTEIETETERRQLRQFRVLRMDGQELDVEGVHSSIMFQGQPAVQMVLRDVTERKRAEAALRSSDAKLRLATANAGLVLSTQDRELRYTWMCNPRQGFSETGCIGKTDEEMLGPDNAAMVRPIKETVLQTGVGRREKIFYTVQGEDAWYELTVEPIHDEEGQVQGLSCAALDITERQRNLDALQASEAAAKEETTRLEAVLEATPAIIWIAYDRDCRQVRDNEMARRFLRKNLRDPAQADVEQQRGQQRQYRWFRDGKELDRKERPLQVVARTGQPLLDHAVELRFDDGTRRSLMGNVIPIHDAMGQPAGGIAAFLDVTEHKQAEEALREAKQNLEARVQERTAELTRTVSQLQAEASRRALIETVLRRRSDQLRALASELTLTEQRERRRLAGVLHDDLQQFLVGAKFRLISLNRSTDPAVRQAGGELQELIEQSIECSRTLTGELSPPILHHGGLVPALEWLAGWMREKHGMTIDLQTEKDADLESEDMKILLFQSVRELLLNAVKHAQVNTAQVSLRRISGAMELMVSDQGVGFDPQAAIPHTGRAGFGLFSIRERLDLLGGTLEVESAPGQGSRFRLLAPLEPTSVCPEEDTTSLRRGRSARTSAPQPGTAPGPADGEQRPIRILLVDDHVVVRQALAYLLQEEPDLEIVGEASDGRSAIEMVRKLQPEVVTMDISLPGIDGIEATRIVHAEFPKVRVIGLSMFSDDVQAKRMLDAGAVQYLTKNGPADVLLAAIRGHAKSMRRSGGSTV
jgi:PAS domain S-box-containing protein